MLRKIIAVAITTGLARKAWERYHRGRKGGLMDITDVIARPVAVDRQGARKLGARRRREGPGS